MKKILIFLLSIGTLGAVWFLISKEEAKSGVKRNPVKKPQNFKNVENARNTKTGTKTNTKPNASTKTRGNLNPRQTQLLELLDSGKAHAMSSIEQSFPKVNVRTLRRDLDKLQQMGLIKKTGSTKAALYRKL